MAPGSRAPAELPALLRKIYRERRLFTTLLLNLDMVPTKSDIAIASRYAALVDHSVEVVAPTCLMAQRASGGPLRALKVRAQMRHR